MAFTVGMFVFCFGLLALACVLARSRYAQWGQSGGYGWTRPPLWPLMFVAFAASMFGGAGMLFAIQVIG